MKKVTMQDIADSLGLTKVSVSKALSGQPGVSEKTRKRILETAAQMGYAGKHKALPVHKRFAVLVAKRFFLETDAFYTEIAYHLNEFCLQDGHQLYTIVLSEEKEDALELPVVLREHLFDGVFLLGELSDAYVRMFAKQSLHAVAVDFDHEALNTDCILTDNFHLGFAAAQYLIRAGHRKIGFVGNIFQTNSIMDRYFGYIKALTLENLPIRSDWRLINNDPYNMYLMDVMLPEEMPTAFVCHCDMAAYYMIETLQRAGMQVSQQVSLISFDNTALSQRTTPQLTSFDINRRDIASQAYRCMLNLDAVSSRKRRLFVSNELVERESVAWIHRT